MTPQDLTYKSLRTTRFFQKEVLDELLAAPPLGASSHLLHALEAVKRGEREEVKRLASRAYQLGVELATPQLRHDAEVLLNAAGWVVGRE